MRIKKLNLLAQKAYQVFSGRQEALRNHGTVTLLNLEAYESALDVCEVVGMFAGEDRYIEVMGCPQGTGKGKAGRAWRRKGHVPGIEIYIGRFLHGGDVRIDVNFRQALSERIPHFNIRGNVTMTMLHYDGEMIMHTFLIRGLARFSAGVLAEELGVVLRDYLRVGTDKPYNIIYRALEETLYETGRYTVLPITAQTLDSCPPVNRSPI